MIYQQTLKSNSCQILNKLLVSDNINDIWSKHQLIHAIAIMVYYHMLACFCMSIGLLYEYDSFNKELLVDYKGDSEAETPRERTQSAEIENNKLVSILF